MSSIEVSSPFGLLSDGEIATRIDGCREQMEYWAERRGRLEMELIQRMEERHATVLDHPTLEVKLEYPPPAYAADKLQSLAELVSPEVLATGYTPAHEEVVQVPAKWDMRVVRYWPSKYGDEVAAVLDGAKLQGGAPRVRVKPKEMKVP